MSANPSSGASAPAASPASARPLEALAAGAAREGSAAARLLDSARLVVADEDHRALHVVALPVAAEGGVDTVAMPGPPAQALALPGRVLVTIRDPGLLLVLRDDGGKLVEERRVELPADAWGVAATPDGLSAVVTSAWSARVSLVDLASGQVRWSTAVAREPRGAAVRADGKAVYVTHLTSGSLTRLSLADGKASGVSLPAAPLRAPMGKALSVSLGYAATLSADGRRLFAARHAIGALGHESWFGASTVDVLLTDDDSPLSPRYYAGAPRLKSDLASTLVSGGDVEFPGGALGAFVQPRALALRASARSLLVASEGNDELVELDTRAVDPTLAIRRVYPLGKEVDPVLTIATACGAPSGVALSADEATAYVFCRSTYGLATVPLAASDDATPGAISVRSLAQDPLDPDASKGRRIFYNARDAVTSGGLGCAGCHPDGRDDGQVWHEAVFTTAAGDNANFVGIAENVPPEARKKGVPRRTPLIAGRVTPAGPYGWRGESKDLVARLRAGFGLHRWGGIPAHTPANLDARALFLVPFLRRGLAPPPRLTRDLNEQERKGREIFSSAQAQCSACHPIDNDTSTRAVLPLPERPTLAGYDREPGAAYRTPSLHHLEGRAPYFHDGSVASLDELIDKNNDRMGKTNHLSADERAALVAFLKSL